MSIGRTDQTTFHLLYQMIRSYYFWRTGGGGGEACFATLTVTNWCPFYHDHLSIPCNHNTMPACDALAAAAPVTRVKPIVTPAQHHLSMYFKFLKLKYINCTKLSTLQNLLKFFITCNA